MTDLLRFEWVFDLWPMRNLSVPGPWKIVKISKKAPQPDCGGHTRTMIELFLYRKSQKWSSNKSLQLQVDGFFGKWIPRECRTLIPPPYPPLGIYFQLQLLKIKQRPGIHWAVLPPPPTHPTDPWIGKIEGVRYLSLSRLLCAVFEQKNDLLGGEHMINLGIRFFLIFSKKKTTTNPPLDRYARPAMSSSQRPSWGGSN